MANNKNNFPYKNAGITSAYVFDITADSENDMPSDSAHPESDGNYDTKHWSPGSTCECTREGTIYKLNTKKEWVKWHYENDYDTTYELEQDETDGHIISLKGSDSSINTITIPDTTYSIATFITDGLMSKDDKYKLDHLLLYQPSQTLIGTFKENGNNHNLFRKVFVETFTNDTEHQSSSLSNTCKLTSITDTQITIGNINNAIKVSCFLKSKNIHANYLEEAIKITYYDDNTYPFRITMSPELFNFIKNGTNYVTAVLTIEFYS